MYKMKTYPYLKESKKELEAETDKTFLFTILEIILGC